MELAVNYSIQAAELLRQDQINNSSWGRPWIVTFEYGGIGGMWEKMTRAEILVEQIPRLYSMLNK